MTGIVDRQEYRVDALDDYVEELALWLDRPAAARLGLDRLGPPDALMAPGGGARLLDLSPKGVGVRFPASGTVCQQGRTLYVYMKLRAPWEDAGGRLSLFLFARVVRAEADGSDCLAGLRLLAKGLPERGEKAFGFLDADRYGVMELSRWCDEFSRHRRSGRGIPPPGLDLDRLLAEIAAFEASRVSSSPS